LYTILEDASNLGQQQFEDILFHSSLQVSIAKDVESTTECMAVEHVGHMVLMMAQFSVDP
jgi:hypothetical protein